MSPCALYGLGAATLTTTHLERLDIVQRKMFRNIVGWTRIPNEAWRDTMTRMNARIEKAVALHPVPTWSSEVLRRKWAWAGRVRGMSADRWPQLVANWLPSEASQRDGCLKPTRRRGRPQTRWEDDLRAFCLSLNIANWKSLAALGPDAWANHSDSFVAYHEPEH